MSEISNKDILRLQRLISKHKESIKEIQKNCEHDKNGVGYNDGWNGYDYPTVTTSSVDFICNKCGVHITKFCYCGHGITLSEKERQWSEEKIYY